jgi:hypothetical protein
MFRRKRILGGLKAYLRATDHTSSNIISRETCVRAHLRDGCSAVRIHWGTDRGRRQGYFFSNRYFLGCKRRFDVFLFFLTVFFDLPVALVGNFVFRRKRILGGLKTYLRATDHTSSNIISRR